MNLFRKKNISEVIADADKKSLKKTLSAFDLIMIGIGCTIGTGIFVITGIAAAKYAGPAISISYLIAALVCVFAALAYAELASMVNVSGSAYTYSYVTMGEFTAWIVGWALVLEYGVGASTVASGWSGYMVGIFKAANYPIAENLTKTPFAGGIINLPAVLITLFIGFLLYRGTKQGVVLNRILVATKIGVIFLFLIISAPLIKIENWSDFMPFGVSGVFIAAATVFYAYIGFDAVATAAEECKNPKRDLPIGIIFSAVICAILYIAVSLFLTGIVPYQSLNNSEPLARALRENGSNLGSIIVAIGGIAGMTSVLLVLIYGQSRIFFAMSRDKLIPQNFSKLHQNYDTPHISVLIVTILVSLIAGFFPLKILSHLTSLGTLFSFMVVAVGVIILRFTNPEIKRVFRCPAIYLVAPISILSCGYLTFKLLEENGFYFAIWNIVGLLIYFFYGYKKSLLNQKNIL